MERLLYKAEVFHRRGRGAALKLSLFATVEWAGWFNHRRLLEPIGNIPPADGEEQYYATLDQAAVAA